MPLINFLDRFFTNNITDLKSFARGDASSNYEKFIIKTAIRMIAKTISKCEFQTFEKGDEVRNQNFYLFNIEANKNTSASMFWQSAVEKLLTDGEALIVIEGKELILADSFERVTKPPALNTYKDIKVGDWKIPGTKLETNVLYLKDSVTDVGGILSIIGKDFSSLIASSVSGYQGTKTRKGTLKIPANLPKTLQEEGALQKHIEATMKDFMDPSKDAVYPETNGFEYTEIAQSQGSKSNDSGRETRNFINDMMDLIAIAFRIPPSLLRADTVDTKDALNNYIAFCINPLAKTINDEINRKMYGFELYKQRTYAKLDTSNIKTLDLRDLAGSIDVLNRNGALTIDDIMRLLDKEPIGGELGGARFVTKNLELLENALEETDLKGGD